MLRRNHARPCDALVYLSASSEIWDPDATAESVDSGEFGPSLWSPTWEAITTVVHRRKNLARTTLTGEPNLDIG